MSTQRPHHVSNQESQNPDPPRSVEAYYTKRTLNKTHATGVPPLYLTPTEVGDPPTTKKHETNPIPGTAAIPPRWAKVSPDSSGNPICPAPTITTNQKMQNEPNSRTPSVPPPPISAKRTQFPHTKCPTAPHLCETNPIPAHQVSHHPLFQRNEPNLPSRHAAHDPKNTKRTQFRIPHAPPTAEKRETNPISPPRHPDYAKRTQFPLSCPLRHSRESAESTNYQPIYAKRTQFAPQHPNSK